MFLIMWWFYSARIRTWQFKRLEPSPMHEWVLTGFCEYCSSTLPIDLDAYSMTLWLHSPFFQGTFNFVSCHSQALPMLLTASHGLQDPQVLPATSYRVTIYCMIYILLTKSLFLIKYILWNLAHCFPVYAIAWLWLRFSCYLQSMWAFVSSLRCRQLRCRNTLPRPQPLLTCKQQQSTIKWFPNLQYYKNKFLFLVNYSVCELML